jgi:hypothetical protein
MLTSSLIRMSRTRSVLMIMVTCLDVASVWSQSPANPDGTVSFRRDVEPILQMHCTSCHHPGSAWWLFSDAGGLSTASYEALMKGGAHGTAIMPGRPAQSLLMARVIETDDVGMPLFSPRLSAAQIDTLRSWIAQGARKDETNVPGYSLELEAISRPRNGLLQVACRVLDTAFLSVEIVDPVKHETLAEQFATVKWTNQGYGDKTSPGEWVSWSFGWHESWGNSVNIRLSISDVPAPPIGAAFIEGNLPIEEGPAGQIDLLPNPIAERNNATGKFRFWLDDMADLKFDIARGAQAVFTDSRANIPPGSRSYSWNLRVQNGQLALPGDYSARLQFQNHNGGPAFAAAVYFRIVQ